MAFRFTALRSAIVLTIGLLASAIVTGQESRPNGPLVVHEWGTFTSLQDELGNAIGGINVDDEPVPNFVHRVAGNLVLRSQATTNLFAKSLPRSHPDVTMRLETPVVYFHPAPGVATPLRVNVEVAFPAGWLSEYYPHAEVEAPGVKGSTFGPLTAATTGRLKWHELQVGTDAAGPETNSPVWLAPREVEAANITAAGGESERYLFYRGVGHVDSPLRVSREDASDKLVVTANFPAVGTDKESELVVPALWLVEIRDDKSCAFRTLEAVRITNDGKPRQVAATSATFDDAQFSAEKIDRLSASMRTALIDDGLNADEADALLRTWRASYFESPGLRLFYLLPREWTERLLPMKVSVDAKIVRTMIGRVEIVTPRQRELLGQIVAGPPSNALWMNQPAVSCAAPPTPVDYAAYQSLGRFRNALVLDELKRRPSKGLQTFVNNYGLGSYVPAAASLPTALGDLESGGN